MMRRVEKKISRGKSKYAASTWGRAGAVAGGQTGTNDYLPLNIRCLFEGNKIFARMWRDVADPTQTPVPHRLFLP